MLEYKDIEDNEVEVSALQELLFQPTEIEERIYNIYYFADGYVDEMEFRSVPIESYLLYADVQSVSRKWSLKASDQVSVKLPNPVLHKLKFLLTKSKNGLGQIFVLERRSRVYGTTRHYLVRAEEGFFIHLSEQLERSRSQKLLVNRNLFKVSVVLAALVGIIFPITSAVAVISLFIFDWKKQKTESVHRSIDGYLKE